MRTWKIAFYFKHSTTYSISKNDNATRVEWIESHFILAL